MFSADAAEVCEMKSVCLHNHGPSESCWRHIAVIEVMSSAFAIRSARSRYRNHSSSETLSVPPVGHFVSLANIVFKIIINTGDGGAREQPLYFS